MGLDEACRCLNVLIVKGKERRGLLNNAIIDVKGARCFEFAPRPVSVPADCLRGRARNIARKARARRETIPHDLALVLLRTHVDPVWHAIVMAETAIVWQVLAALTNAQMPAYAVMSGEVQCVRGAGSNLHAVQQNSRAHATYHFPAMKVS